MFFCQFSSNFVYICPIFLELLRNPEEVVSSVKYFKKQKIDWFKFINFAGTPQDKEHMSSLE